MIHLNIHNCYNNNKVFIADKCLHTCEKYRYYLYKVNKYDKKREQVYIYDRQILISTKVNTVMFIDLKVMSINLTTFETFICWTVPGLQS